MDDILNLQKIYSKTLSKKQANKGDIYRNKIKFKYLSGYPLIQYNLAKVLFNTLSINEIIKIFLFTFLESDIIFFSENIEYLTFTLNAYMNFNFPFNDAEYFYNISAISLESFKKGDNLLGEAIYTNMIGINNIYVEDYITNNNKLDEHIVVDLDKGKISALAEKGNDSYKKIFKLIDIICENKIKDEKVKKTKLYRAIFNLNKRLEEAFKKKDRGQKLINFNEEPQSGSIDELNKSIQEAFYECVINLSLYCYENVLVQENKSNNKDKKDERNNSFMKKVFNEKYKIDGNYIEEELIILNELRSSMKFQSSICNFLVENKPLDLYKIPLTFTDEFISYIIIEKLEIDTSKIEYFNLIDKLYLDQKQNDYKIIDFSSDITKYLDNYKDEFNKYINERNANMINDYSQIVDYLGERVLKYQTYELDLNIILKYACIIKGLSEENYIKLISDNFEKEDNQIKDISLKEIETKIENYFLDNISISNLTNSEICCINIILLFSISLNILPAKINCNPFICILFQKFIVFRKYC